MSNRASRYRTTDDTDLHELIQSLERRVSDLERMPRVGSTSIDSGQLTVRDGDIVVEDSSGIPVIRIFRNSDNGDNPEIRFSPLGPASTHVNAIYSEDTLLNGVEQTVAYFRVVQESGFVWDGGSVELYETGSKLGYRDAGSGLESGFEAGTISGLQARLRIKGRWFDQVQVETIDAVYTGAFVFGAGFGGVTYTYFSTFASTMLPVLGLLNSGGAVAWNLSAMSASSFTVVWGGTAAKTVNMWVVRV